MTYNQVKSRVILVSKPVLILELKDPKFHYYKSCIIYKFSCFCKRICIGQTTRHLKTRVNEHIPKYILKFIKEKTKYPSLRKIVLFRNLIAFAKKKLIRK